MSCKQYTLEEWQAEAARYYEKLASLPPPTIPEFAKACNTVEAINEFCRVYPEGERTSEYTNSPFSNPKLARAFKDDLAKGLTLPCEWYVILPAPAPASYYPQSPARVREVGTVRNTVLKGWDRIAYPPHLITTPIISAKYLRIGNVNDAFCLPPSDRVKAAWGGCETLQQAVAEKRCRTVWIVEGIKKAAYLMQHTDHYAIAVSGCWQFTEGKKLLPTVAWLRDNLVNFKLLTDVDYVSNSSVFAGVNQGVKVMRSQNVSLTVYRTLSEVEVKDNTMQPTNQPISLVGSFSHSNVGDETQGQHNSNGFKWNNSGIDDVAPMTNNNVSKAMKPVDPEALNEKPSATCSPKDTALGFLRSCSSRHRLCVSTDATIYWYDNKTESYCQAIAGDKFHRELMQFCGKKLLSDKRVRNAATFMQQVWQDLPIVAMLVGDELNIQLINLQQLASSHQPTNLMGAGLIDEDGTLQSSSPDVFSTRQLAISLEEMKAAHTRMTELSWSPIKDLVTRLDVAQFAAHAGLSVFDFVKAILTLEIALPATGGSYNGVEAVFFQTCCSGGGKTVADAAINRILGIENVATNINLEGLASNRFAKAELAGKVVATASDIQTLSEVQETALRNSFGMTIVERKHQDPYKAMLTPVFRLSSNYDKPYLADVANAMGRRTIIKRYIKPLLKETWAGSYDSPVDYYFDLYAALLYEVLVVNPQSRAELERLFTLCTSACAAKKQPIIANTGELIVERACVYTGEAGDRITMMQLHTVGSNFAPLYGISTAKNALNLHDTLTALQIKRATTQAQEAGLPPIKLEWDSYYKDWALVGYSFDKEWLVQLAKDTLKTTHIGHKANAALGLLTYFTHNTP